MNLTEKQEQVIGMLYINGYTQQQIAVIMKGSYKKAVQPMAVYTPEGTQPLRAFPIGFTAMANKEQKLIEGMPKIKERMEVVYQEARDAFKQAATTRDATKAMEQEVLPNHNSGNTTYSDQAPTEPTKIETTDPTDHILPTDPNAPMTVYQQELVRINKLQAMSNVNGICSVCKGKGYIYVRTNTPLEVVTYQCPKCGGVKARGSVYQHSLTDSDIKAYIPNATYRLYDFDVNKLDEAITIDDAYKTTGYQEYLNTLDRTYSDFSNGILPMQSLILTAPDNFGKKHYIYSCIKQCLYNGYKPTTLLDSYVLQELLNKENILRLQHELEGDIIFITLNNIESYKVKPPLLKYLSDYADRTGVPIVMLSRLPYKQVVSYGNRTDFFTEHVAEYDYGHFLQAGFSDNAFTAITNTLKDHAVLYQAFADKEDTEKPTNEKTDYRITKAQTRLDTPIDVAESPFANALGNKTRTNRVLAKKLPTAPKLETKPDTFNLDNQ